jgi:hypothetical protein
MFLVIEIRKFNSLSSNLIYSITFSFYSSKLILLEVVSFKYP